MVLQLGGPNWTVPLGRRDSDQALKVQLDSIAGILLGDLDTKIAAFNVLGFTKDEYVALQGMHQCMHVYAILPRPQIFDSRKRNGTKNKEQIIFCAFFSFIYTIHMLKEFFIHLSQYKNKYIAAIHH